MLLMSTQLWFLKPSKPRDARKLLLSGTVFNTYQNPLTYLRFPTHSPLNVVIRFSELLCTYVTIVLLMNTELWILMPPKPRDARKLVFVPAEISFCFYGRGMILMTAKVIATPNTVQTSGS